MSATSAIRGEEQHPLVLKKLRAKFIAINMAMALIVFGLTVGFVSYLDYTTRVVNVYNELEFVLSEATSPTFEQLNATQPLHRIVPSTTEGSSSSEDASNLDGSAASAPEISARVVMSSKGLDSSGSVSNSASASSSNSSQASSSAPTELPPTIGMASSRNKSVILIAVYDVSRSGIYTVITDYTNAMIPEQVILRANDEVLNNTEDRGFLRDFDLYYMRVVSPNDPDNYFVAYADGSSVNDWRTLLFWLIGVMVAALTVFFVINIFFSRWALRPVETSIKQQQQFTADASHELKTPLTVIIANMAILKSKPADTIAEQMQWIESTNTEAERMQLLVNDMLALSRPERHKQSMSHECVDFSDIVESEVLQFESVAFELGVELDCEIEESLYVNGDAQRLGRMVATLIDNACKYASKPAIEDAEDAAGQVVGEAAEDAAEGAVHMSRYGDNDVIASDVEVVDVAPEVFVALAQRSVSGMRGGAAELKVHNTGPAIPKEDLPHIFTRFYRADKVRTSSKGGYGLGLAIGHEIVQEHNGEISVTSSSEAGTTFTIVIPLSTEKRES